MTLDLRSWIGQVEKLGLLRTVKGADWNLEIGAVTDLNAKRNRYTLLFDEIKDYPAGFRILTGALLDYRRVALSLGLTGVKSDAELVRLLKDKLESALASAEKYKIRELVSPPVMENVRKGKEVDLLSFPAPKWFEYDGGRYLGTADVVVTKDPESDWVNVGTYRIMVHDGKTLGILMEGPRHGRAHLLKYFDSNKPCPVAISFGHHPALFLFSGMDVPQGLSEYNLVGALLGESYATVKGPVTRLPIPADSEIAVEGYIVNEPREEGPLGEFTGYYGSGMMKEPIVKVEGLYYRNQPVILGTCAGRPPYDYSYLRCPVRAALIWSILEKAGVSNVKGVWCHEAGYSRAFTVVSIKQAYAGHARQAGYIASQCRPGAVSSRFVVVVDEDIDPTSLNDVVWAMCSRCDPVSSLEIIRESLGTPLDPTVEAEQFKDFREFYSSRAILFACKPFKKLLRGTFPRSVEVSEASKELVEKKFHELLTPQRIN